LLWDACLKEAWQSRSDNEYVVVLQNARCPRQRSGGVEKYSWSASPQAPEHGSTEISPGPDSKISAAAFSAQLMQTPARSIPQPVQVQLGL
jgi:hypothetical protein